MGRHHRSVALPSRVLHVTVTAQHVVLYNGEHDNANAEEDLIDALRAAGADWMCPEGLLSRACETLVLSMGGGSEGRLALCALLPLLSPSPQLKMTVSTL